MPDLLGGDLLLVTEPAATLHQLGKGSGARSGAAPMRTAPGQRRSARLHVCRAQGWIALESHTSFSDGRAFICAPAAGERRRRRARAGTCLRASSSGTRRWCPGGAGTCTSTRSPTACARRPSLHPDIPDL